MTTKKMHFADASPAAICRLLDLVSLTSHISLCLKKIQSRYLKMLAFLNWQQEVKTEEDLSDQLSHDDILTVFIEFPLCGKPFFLFVVLIYISICLNITYRKSIFRHRSHHLITHLANCALILFEIPSCIESEVFLEI